MGDADVLPGQVLEEELRVGAGVRGGQGGEGVGQQRAALPQKHDHRFVCLY